jgi:GT2 family glycosyltransferase
MRETGLGELDGPPYLNNKDVDYLVGACLLVNLQAARDVGLLDEDYFFYFEDMDWSLRFIEAGYRLRLAADAHLYHRVALSTGGEEDSAHRRYYLAYGSVLFWKRNAHFGNPAVIAAFRAISAVKMVTRLLLSRRPDVATAYLRGLRDGWRAAKEAGS